MSRRPLLLFVLSLAATLLADRLAGPPQLISAPVAPNLWAALFFHFILWLLAIRGWGSCLARFLGSTNQSEGLRLGMGSFLYALIAFAMGALGLLRPELRWFLFFVNAAGIALNPRLWDWPAARRGNPILIAAALPLAILLLLNGLDSLVIHPYWDPLHHHLLGPRLWWEMGKMYFPPDHISAYQEGGFEQLFLWPHFYFARAGGAGLLPVQLFAQLTHFILGYGGAILVALALARQFIPGKSGRLLAVTLFAVPASLQFGIPTAKNDWGLVLWVLTAFLLLFEKKRSARAASGALFGYCLLAKFSAVYAILPILALALLFLPELRRPSAFFTFALAFMLGMMPLALRNFLGAGNPFFPLFAGLFPDSAMGPTWREAMVAYQAGHEPLPQRLLELGREFLYAPALLLLPILWKKSEPAQLRILAIAFPLGFTLFLITAGAPAELRLIGTCLPLAGMLAGALLDRLSQRFSYSGYVPLILLGLSLPFFPFRWDAMGRTNRISHPELQARSYVGSEAQAYFRENFRPGWKAALLVETRLYHSMPYPVVRIWDSPALDSRLRPLRKAPDFLSALKAEGFTHLILTQEKLDLFYPRELVAEVESWILANEKGVVFRTPYSMVVELASF